MKRSQEESHGIVSTRWADSPQALQEPEQPHEIIGGKAIQVAGRGTNEGGASAPSEMTMFVESTCCDTDNAASRDFVKTFKEWFDSDDNDAIIDYSSYASTSATQKALDDFFAIKYDTPFKDHSDSEGV